jgi:hypothetical protein
MMAENFDVNAPHEQQSNDPGSLRIAIQDSTGGDRSKMRPLIRSLEQAGYRNVYVSKSWGEPLEVTHIVAQQGDGNSAESIRNSLGFGEVRVESTGNLGSDVTIQLGKDWLQQIPPVEVSPQR